MGTGRQDRRHRPVADRHPRSNPATYTSVFDHVRKLFQRSRCRKRSCVATSRAGSRSTCAGDDAGTAPATVRSNRDARSPTCTSCEVCKGKQYNRETLEVQYKGRSIADVLEMSVDEALEFFQHIPRSSGTCRRSTSASATCDWASRASPVGEAQRIKLSSELHKRATGNTMYVLDEPTTGLHFEDVRKLLAVLQRLVDRQHRARDRAQPRRDRDRRLADRPRTRGRRGSSTGSSPRHARVRCRRTHVPHGADSSPRPWSVRSCRSDHRLARPTG